MEDRLKAKRRVEVLDDVDQVEKKKQQHGSNEINNRDQQATDRVKVLYAMEILDWKDLQDRVRKVLADFTVCDIAKVYVT